MTSHGNKIDTFINLTQELYNDMKSVSCEKLFVFSLGVCKPLALTVACTVFFIAKPHGFTY